MFLAGAVRSIYVDVGLVNQATGQLARIDKAADKKQRICGRYCSAGNGGRRFILERVPSMQVRLLVRGGKNRLR